jgi:hypothetical protein
MQKQKIVVWAICVLGCKFDSPPVLACLCNVALLVLIENLEYATV